MNKSIKIAVVGAGASGISLVNQIIKSIPATLVVKGLEILLFESKQKVEGGNAYSHDIASNLMNTKCGAIDRNYGEGFGILNWAKNNEGKWKKYMPDKNIDEDTYVPRPVVGAYLADLLQYTIKKAKRRGIRINIVNHEVLDISNHHCNYNIMTKGDNYITQYVYLTVGHLNAKKTHSYQFNSHYYHNPYPIQRLIKEIPKGSTVGIIGSRLSAFDVALGLSTGGHTGKIISISRNGRLPAVRAEYGRYRFKDMEREKLIEQIFNKNSELSLLDIQSMLKKEIIHAEGREITLKEIMRKDLSPIEYYENEVFLSKDKERPWQAAIYATNSNIDILWHFLKEDDKYLLMSTWFSDWLTYRASIPRENAEKILALMKSDQLLVEGYSKSFEFDEKVNKFKLYRTNEQSTLEVDYLISAVGSTNDITKADSPLLEKLMSRGLIKPHKYGGIDCCFSTGRAFPSYEHGEKQQDCRLFVMGPLTSGVYFFTTALEVIERQAKARGTELSFMLANDIYNQSIAGLPIPKPEVNAVDYMPKTEKSNADKVNALM